MARSSNNFNPQTGNVTEWLKRKRCMSQGRARRVGAARDTKSLLSANANQRGGVISAGTDVQDNRGSNSNLNVHAQMTS